MKFPILLFTWIRSQPLWKIISSSTKRHDDDKILTKTMINNYAKNKLPFPAGKKRYSRSIC